MLTWMGMPTRRTIVGPVSTSSFLEAIPMKSKRTVDDWIWTGIWVVGIIGFITWILS